jgi:hypothetical protein
LLSSHNIHGRSKEQVIQDYKNYPGIAGSDHRLVTFEPKGTSFQPDAQKWVVSGCARLSGVTVSIDAFVVAWRENGDWYFSDVDTLLPRDTSFKACSYETGHKPGRTKHRKQAIHR